MKPGDLVIYKTPRVKRRDPPDHIMIFDCSTCKSHPWRKGNLGVVIKLDQDSNGAIVMADGHTGWVSLNVIRALDEAG